MLRFNENLLEAKALAVRSNKISLEVLPNSDLHLRALPMPPGTLIPAAKDPIVMVLAGATTVVSTKVSVQAKRRGKVSPRLSLIRTMAIMVRLIVTDRTR